MQRLIDIINEYEKLVPLHLSMAADNNGLKVGHPEKLIENIMTCLEVTPEVIDVAIANKIDLLFVHHDPMYHPFKFIRYDDAQTNLVLSLIKNDIALYVSHTNLDVVDGGLNDYIFKQFKGVKPSLLDNTEKIGRFGLLEESMRLGDYLQNVVRPLTNDFRITSNQLDKRITSIAVVNGSGADYAPLAYEKDVDLFITGDVDYHMAMFGKTYDLPILDIGHEYEYVVADLLVDILQSIKTANDFYYNTIAFKGTFTPWESIDMAVLKTDETNK